jgi:hypothetical protein|tara:strand:- start:660 stop:902 length:243 start_codon:yes stop_codon:yes gene_type:complete
MDWEQELNSVKEELKTKLSQYHNAVFSVCVREAQNWDQSNKLLIDVIDTNDRMKKLQMKVSKDKLQQAFNKLDNDILTKE